MNPSAYDTVLDSHTWRYNAQNLRDRDTLPGSRRWDYLYNSRGEVESGIKSLSTGVTINGNSFQYTYDNIGNRATTTANGEAATYAANNRNQYSQRTVPGVVQVTGTSPQPTVNVNGAVASRQESLFYSSVTQTNTATAAYPTITIQEIDSTGAVITTQSGKRFVAKTPELFVHDLDGNLTSDGRWTYSWDAENRLIAVQTQESVVTVGVPKVKVEYDYDWRSRRIQRRQYSWNASTNVWNAPSVTKFVYDMGWHVLAELDGSNRITTQYFWGLDISGTRGGAGGIGGLLAIYVSFPAYSDVYYQYYKYIPFYDGNGNVTGLMNSSSGVASGAFEYNPFGETITDTAAGGSYNRYRFSTKYTDATTGLVDYGYRFYSPSLGRWLSRDPISERGGPNLYGFAYNSPMTFIDPLGLAVTGTYPCPCDRAKVNRLIDDYSKKAGRASKNDLQTVPKAIRDIGESSGREFGGRICCNTVTKEVGVAAEPEPGEWKKSVSFWRGESIDILKTTTRCSKKGKDWEEIAELQLH